jgi:serine/threonine-protein kinase
VEDQVFGKRYRVLEKIGTGGMADVYKAVDEVLGRTVAVKVMHEKYASDPSFAVRFRQEAQAAANLQSPHIVNMYDWGADGDTYYMVMEYVRGNDLKSIIQQKGSLASAKVADIGAQICSALTVAHGYDIIHRDIKPHNIMVQPDGSVKVMDFGIARATNTTMTQTGSVLGTAHYVSPEQAQGKELHATSDLYSLGIVLYESSTGHVPFDADTPVAVALKQVNEQPKPPRAVNPNVSPELEAIIVKAMQKNPAHRYASAEEMRRDLLAVAQGGQPIGAAVGGPIPASGGVPAAQTAVMPTVGGSGQQQPQMRRQSTPPRKKSVWPWLLLVAALIATGIGVAWALMPSTVTVPDLSGKSEAAAKAALAESNFGVGEVTRDYSDTVPLGSVISQNPPKDSPQPKGTLVSFVVSRGPKPTDVPDVVGKTDSDAVRILKDAGFEPVFGGSDWDAKVPAGQVTSQTPVAHATATKGSQITYFTSKGPKLNTVPDVTGLSESEASKRLKTVGFKTKISHEFDSTVDAGDVVSQDPNPATGGSYPAGTVVKLVISDGAGVVIPAYSSQGGQLQDTIDDLRSLGLKPSPSSTTSATAEALVNSTSPSAGTRVKKGTKVTIHY